MGFLYKVKVGKDENGGFYYTLLCGFLNTHLSEVMTMKERDEDEFLIQVCVFSFNYLIFYIKFSM